MTEAHYSLELPPTPAEPPNDMALFNYVRRFFALNADMDPEATEVFSKFFILGRTVLEFTAYTSRHEPPRALRRASYDISYFDVIEDDTHYTQVRATLLGVSAVDRTRASQHQPSRQLTVWGRLIDTVPARAAVGSPEVRNREALDSLIAILRGERKPPTIMAESRLR